MMASSFDYKTFQHDSVMTEDVSFPKTTEAKAIDLIFIISIKRLPITIQQSTSRFHTVFTCIIGAETTLNIFGSRLQAIVMM